MNVNNLITDFVIALDSSLTTHECFNALVKSVESLGFTGLVYSSMPIGLKGLPPVFLASSNFSATFLKHYLEANFLAEDFTIKRILDGNLNTFNWWTEEEKNQLTTEEKHVIEVAKFDYGITNGISVPTLSQPHHIAGASIIAENNNTLFNKLLSERLCTLKTIINLFHQRVYFDIECKKTFYLPLLETLNISEKQVLKFTTTGTPYKNIGDFYNISPSLASNIRSDLFKKLDVKNVSELSYLLGLHNLVEML